MTPRLLLFRSLWTNAFDLEAALADCRTSLFDGVEGPLPQEKSARQEFCQRIRDAGVPFIAEVVTGGNYVPEFRSPAQHLEDFHRQAAIAAESSPLFLNVLAGSDAWPLGQSVDLLGRAIEVAEKLGIEANFETHRSRPTFSPWSTRDLLEQLPKLRLTSDFSHWCCVCERLVLDGEPGLLAKVAARTNHIHARVGYAQGPQVPHPAAPEYRAALEAHERWWDAIWTAHAASGRSFTSMTPEFGPDGYLQARPFTGEPAAELDEINRWMAARQRERFAVQTSPPASTPAVVSN
jgi:hypothetical protein